MQKMKVSIITTCYNREATIRDCIESVLAQDYADIEYIIIDGASQDRSMDIINEYKDKISLIVSERDGGMYEAINKGIRLATGDVVGLMHSDDVFYASDRISRWVSAFEEGGVDIVYGNGLFVKQDDTNVVVRNWVSGTYSKRRIKNGWLPLHPTVYIKRACFAQAGYYDESFRIAADSDFLIRYLYQSDFSIAYIDEYIVRMRMGGLSTSPGTLLKKWKEDLRMYRKNSFAPYYTLFLKVLSKIPQFFTAARH